VQRLLVPFTAAVCFAGIATILYILRPVGNQPLMYILVFTTIITCVAVNAADPGEEPPGQTPPGDPFDPSK
jgi:hypothetical protein